MIHRAASLLLTLAAGLGFAQTGARYLIITHDNFYDAVQPLAEWKNQKGMLCVVKKTSQIGNQNSQVRNYIVNAWNTWNPRPEFVLLVGSGSYVTAFTHGYQHWRIYSDNYYGNMSGDYRMELPVGRLPCRTARQCSVMVAKTLAYERFPDLSDPDWFRRGTAVIRDSGDSDAYTYWRDSRLMAGLMQVNGYASVDSLASSRHKTAADVVNSVNNGTGFVLYRGTATSNWYTPFAVNPGATSNGKRLPIVCSFTCETVTLNGYDTMVGDAWLKAGTPQSLTGAVAFVGNTHSGVHIAPRRSSMTRGFFVGVFAESVPTLGAALLRGKEQIFNDWRDSMEYFGFNVLGDPELNLWTATPAGLNVEYDSVVPTEPFPFLVTVSREGRPVANALVCVRSSAMGIYEYRYTDEAGLAFFSLAPGQAGTIQVTVTGRNCLPHEGSCRADPMSAVDEEPVRQPTAVTRLRVGPNPGRGRFQLEAPVGSRLAVYAGNGRRVSAMMTLAGQPLSWDAGELPAGLYFVRAEVPGGFPATLPLQLVK